METGRSLEDKLQKNATQLREISKVISKAIRRDVRLHNKKKQLGKQRNESAEKNVGS